MRVLVAGDRGYIGAVLVTFLRGAGHRVGEDKNPRAEPFQTGESPGVGGARMGRS